MVTAIKLRAKTPGSNCSDLESAKVLLVLGVFVAVKWIENVFKVKRVSIMIILVKIIVGQRVFCFLSVHAPQCGLSDAVKVLFYNQLRAVTAMHSSSHVVIEMAT